MRPRRALEGHFNVLGGRVPVVVGILIALTLGGSILGALTQSSGLPLRELGALTPALVLRGQLWRLVTWVFFESDPLSLIFGCLALFWFGRDLSRAWGVGRFLGVYLGLAAASGAIGCLVAWLVGGPLLLYGYSGPWAMVDGLIVAWAILFPYRSIALYFVLPLQGKNLIWATVIGLLIFALLGGGLAGLLAYVPHFAAILLMLAYEGELSFALQRLWLTLRLRLQGARSGRRKSRLRVVDREDAGQPPRWLH